MSGILALFNRDGAPVSRTILRRLSDQMSGRGSDGEGQWLSGNVALAHRMLRTTPESKTETQPFVDPGGFAIVFDGRVDNRPDLMRAVSLLGFENGTTTDAELVLKAYHVFGRLCPLYVLGDFAFAIWDPKALELFCARDALGIKPLYYHASDRLFIAASSLTAILSHPMVGADVNEGMVAEYLAASINSLEETLYRQIQRLSPAHRLVVDCSHIKTDQYFEIDPGREIRYTKDQEYAEHFASLLEEAVRCRLRSSTPVGVCLSGGLDSSTVAAVANRIAGSSQFSGKHLEALSLIFPGMDECDESSYIRDVIAFTGLPSHLARPSEPRAADLREHISRVRDFPDYPNGSMANSMRELAIQRGLRVVLTGLGGDEWLMGSYCHYADLLSRFSIGELARQFRERSILAGAHFSWRTVVRFGLWPLMPAALQNAAKSVLEKNRVPRWIDPSLAARTKLLDRLRDPLTPVFPTLAGRDIYQVFTSGWRVHALEMEERASANCGVEQRHPLSDRRILEFAMAIPEEQRWSKSQTKFVLRNATKDLLPESVRLRRTKAEFSSVFLKAFRSNGGKHLFRNLSIAANGWIRQRDVEAKYSQMDAEYRAGDAGYSRHTCPLWMITGINMWYESGTSPMQIM